LSNVCCAKLLANDPSGARQKLVASLCGEKRRKKKKKVACTEVSMYHINRCAHDEQKRVCKFFNGQQPFFRFEVGVSVGQQKHLYRIWGEEEQKVAYLFVGCFLFFFCSDGSNWVRTVSGMREAANDIVH
jgi:hypothetical protein